MSQTAEGAQKKEKGNPLVFFPGWGDAEDDRSQEERCCQTGQKQDGGPGACPQHGGDPEEKDANLRPDSGRDGIFAGQDEGREASQADESWNAHADCCIEHAEEKCRQGDVADGGHYSRRRCCGGRSTGVPVAMMVMSPSRMMGDGSFSPLRRMGRASLMPSQVPMGRSAAA